MKNSIIPILAFTFLTFGLVQCSDPWDDHIAEGLTDVNQSLLERLSKEENATLFMDLLKSSGLDNNLDGKNAYTVFVPRNETIQSLVANLKADVATLRRFVQNHIAVSTYRLNSSSDTLQLTMLSGKIVDLVNSRVGGVGFVNPNKGSSDGIYHLIDGPLIPQLNLWEYISQNTAYRQNLFVEGLSTYNLLPTALPDDPTDSLLNNEFLQNLGDVRVEKDRFTYFVLENEIFESEVNGFLPYVNYRNHADSSLQISRYHIVRDLLVAQAYSSTDLPDQVTSISGVTIPVDKTDIVETIPLSNGFVHVLRAPNLPLQNKLLDVKIEGEQWSNISASVGNSTFVREKKDPLGQIFKDVMIQNHGVSLLSVNYKLPYLLSTSYDVYWRAVNDIQANVFQQRLAILGMGFLNELGQTQFPELRSFPYTNVALRNYNEVYLGEFKLAQLQQAWARLTGAATTANGTNTLVLDYIRLVPKVKQN